MTAKEAAQLRADKNFNAFADGKKMEWNDSFDWSDLGGRELSPGDFLFRSDRIRVKPELKWRPWKAEEVPVGEVVREKPGPTSNPTNAWLITSVENGDVYLSGTRITTDALFLHYVQNDGSPCGVQENV